MVQRIEIMLKLVAMNNKPNWEQLRKDNPFQVPDHYFDGVVCMERIKSKHKKKNKLIKII